MKSIIFDGAPAWLWDSDIDWRDGFGLSLSLLTLFERGAGGHETRRPAGKLLRTRCSFTSMCEREDFTAIRQGLQQMAGSDLVIVPVFPFRQDYAVNTLSDIFSACLRLTYEPDWSDYELHTGANPGGFTPSAAALIVPVVVGRFDKVPDPDPKTDELAFIEVSFTEASDPAYALQPVAQSYTDGPTTGGQTPKLFPLRPHFRGVKVGSATTSVQIDQIGNEREDVVTYFDQTPSRKLRFEFWQYGYDEFLRLVGFFQAQDADCGTFWLPSYVGDVALTDTATGATITVDEPTSLTSGDFLAVVNAIQAETNAPTYEAVVVTGSDPLSNPVGVSPSLAGSYPAATSIVCSLVLCRLIGQSLDIQFTTDASTPTCGLAKAQLSFSEVADEYTAPAGETIGTTIGALPQRANLFEFTVTEGSTTTVYRYTDNEIDITYGGHTWTHKPFEMGSRIYGVSLEDSSATISSRVFSGNPLNRLLPYSIEGTIALRMFECLPVAGSASVATVVWNGDLSEPKFTGPKLEVRSKNLGQYLGTMFPRLTNQPTCSVSLFSPACGLDPADWMFTGGWKSAPSSWSMEILITAFAGGAVPTCEAHYFAGGWIEFTKGGVHTVLQVLDSTAKSSSRVTLTVDGPPNATPAVDDVMTFWPGCSKRWRDDCVAKFGNTRFRGLPYTPQDNPSILRVPKDSNAGKK